MQANENTVLVAVPAPEVFDSYVLTAVDPETNQVHIRAQWEVQDALDAINAGQAPYDVSRILQRHAARDAANIVAQVGTPTLEWHLKLCNA